MRRPELPPGEVGRSQHSAHFSCPSDYKLPDKTAEAIWINERGRTHCAPVTWASWMRTASFTSWTAKGHDHLRGINIFASDLEQVVSRHPAVKDAVVIGLAHEKWGETPVALVILREGPRSARRSCWIGSTPSWPSTQRLRKIVFREEDLPVPLAKSLRENCYVRLNSNIASWQLKVRRILSSAGILDSGQTQVCLIFGQQRRCVHHGCVSQLDR
jgi:hypothetical protein